MSQQPRFFALIPAAGKSVRMGRPKLALPLGGRTVLERVLEAFPAAGVDRVLVVLAPHGKDLVPLARSAGAEVLLLEAETPDMRATVERGLDWMEENWQPGGHDYWFLSPADHPVLAPDIIRRLRQARDEHPEATLLPTFQGRRGHPALVGWSQVAGIRALPREQGLNVYFRRPGTGLLEVPVDAEEILLDLDTPADYERLRQRFAGPT